MKQIPGPGGWIDDWSGFTDGWGGIKGDWLDD